MKENAGFIHEFLLALAAVAAILLISVGAYKMGQADLKFEIKLYGCEAVMMQVAP